MTVRMVRGRTAAATLWKPASARMASAPNVCRRETDLTSSVASAPLAGLSTSGCSVRPGRRCQPAAAPSKPFSCRVLSLSSTAGCGAHRATLPCESRTLPSIPESTASPLYWLYWLYPPRPPVGPAAASAASTSVKPTLCAGS